MPSSGPLAGRKVVVQPSLSVRGWPAEAGSVALEGFVALGDATVVERLRAAGAAIVASSRMAELGFGLAWDTTAAVLAERHGDVALVADTMGEARHVAAVAGAVGLKPSYGIVSRFGLIGLVPSMECIGVVALTAEDAASVMAALAGPDERDPSMRDAQPPDFAKVGEGQDGVASVGVVRELFDAMEPGEADGFRKSLTKLEDAGIRCEQVSLPDFGLLRTVHNVVGSVEASSAAGKYDSVRYGHRAEGTENWNEMYLTSRAESFGPLVKSYLFQGAYFQFQDYRAFENACRLRRRLVEQTDAVFDETDILAFPARRPECDPASATSIAQVYDAFTFTLAANVTGHPAVYLPGLGAQLIGPALSDGRLLALAARLARAGS